MAGTPAPTPQVCAQDIDCPNATICFISQRTAWVKEKYGPSGAFCGCSRARGFYGYPECSTPGPAYWAELIFHVILFSILACTAFLCVRDLVRLHKVKQFSWTRPTVQTSVLVVIATILHAIALIFTRLCSLPDGARAIGVGFKLCIYTTPLLVFTVLSVLASFLAQANVAVVWLGLVLRVESFSRETNTTLRRLVYGAEGLYFALLLYSAGSLQLTVAIVATVILAIALVVGYVWGGLALASVLRQSLVLAHAQPLRGISQQDAGREGNTASLREVSGVVDASSSEAGRNPLSREEQSPSNTLEESLKRVRNVTLSMAALFFFQICCLISAAIFTVRTGGIAYEEDFWHRPNAIALHMSLLLMIIMNGVVAIYIRSIISSTVNTTQAEQANRLYSRERAHNAVGSLRTKTLTPGQLTAPMDAD